jgi:hypothetical protein
MLKLGTPHPETEQEIDGLRYREGDPTVPLLDADRALNAMLLLRWDPAWRFGVSPRSSRTS